MHGVYYTEVPQWTKAGQLQATRHEKRIPKRLDQNRFGMHEFTAGAWNGWRGSANLDRIDYDPATEFWSPESGPEFLAAHWFGIAKPFEAVPGSILKIGFLYSMNGIQWCALSRPGNCRHLNVITSNFRSFYAASPDVPGRDSPAKLEIELWDLKMKPIGPSLDQTRPSCGCLANSNN